MKVLLTIPIYNEERYIHGVLSAARRYIRDILVVNDGSTDNTSHELLKHHDIKLLLHKTNQGYGQCLIDAFSYGHAHGYDWVITMDCDFQHEPNCIPLFMEAIAQNNADIISGSRYLDPSPSDIRCVPPERRYINRKITELLNNSLGLRITDAFCGFKAYRLNSIMCLSLSVIGYGFPLQLWVQAAKHSLRIVEFSVPLIYHDPKRQFQGSLENPNTRLEYYTNILQNELQNHVNLYSA